MESAFGQWIFLGMPGQRNAVRATNECRGVWPGSKQNKTPPGGKQARM
jgi:hypothetical protein